MTEIAHIDALPLAMAFIPALLVLIVLWRWSCAAGTSAYALLRMLLQLLLVGYVLTYVFASNSAVVVSSVLLVMLLAACWIALRTINHQRKALMGPAVLSIGVTSLMILTLITQFVLQASPWYDPQLLLPLGGMVLSASMNAVSVAAERMESELLAGVGLRVARNRALLAALIPVTNSLFAVGLVTLPGMMTGQILSGVSPLIAARYQIVVMCMLFGASGLAAAAFLQMYIRRVSHNSV